MLKQYLVSLHDSASALNLKQIDELLEPNSNASVVDLGCDDGTVTLKFVAKIGTKDVHGVEVVPERITVAKKRGIKVKSFDLTQKFKYRSNTFDVVVSNQVIEHLIDTDVFVEEIFRILKPGGYAIISTENASSWENIFASVMGWQIFSLTNFSVKRCGLGNPLAINQDKIPPFKSWNHVRILNFYGLKALFEIHGFTVEQMRGAGYFPLPAVLGTLDPIHAHYTIIKVRKPAAAT